MLSQGDIALTAAGERILLKAADEAVQRFLITASVAKGSFMYQRELGVDYSELSADDPLIREKLELRFAEAASGILGARIKVNAVDTVHMTARVTVTACGHQRTTEVNLSGKL